MPDKRSKGPIPAGVCRSDEGKRERATPAVVVMGQGDAPAICTGRPSPLVCDLASRL